MIPYGPDQGGHPAENDAVVSTLTAERARRDLSIRAVARAAGVSPSCVHSWEHGTRAPSLDNLRAWAASLGYDLVLTPTFRNAEWPPSRVDTTTECVGFPPREAARIIPPVETALERDRAAEVAAAEDRAEQAAFDAARERS